MYPWISCTLDFWLQFCEKKCALYMDIYGTYIAPMKWNSLPSNIRSITAIDVFKTYLKCYYDQKYHFSVLFIIRKYKYQYINKSHKSRIRIPEDGQHIVYNKISTKMILYMVFFILKSMILLILTWKMLPYFLLYTAWKWVAPITANVVPQKSCELPVSN